MKKKHKTLINNTIKNKLKVFIIVSLLLFPYWTEAQEFFLDDDSEIPSYSKTNQKKWHFKPKTSISLGTFATYSTGGNYQIGSYIQPKINLSISEKWHLSSGISAMKLYNPQNTLLTETPYFKIISPSSTMSFFVQGDYEVNPRLHLYGAASISQMQFQNISPSPTNQHQELSKTAQDYIFGVHYKIGKNASIQLEIQYSKNKPYPYFNRMNNNRYSNLLAPTPFIVP